MPIHTEAFAYRRDLPHIVNEGRTYFVTFVTKHREVLDDGSRDIVFRCLVHDHRLAYFLLCAVVMPEHVHMILTPYDDFTLAVIMNRVKNPSAHAVNRMLNRQGPLWQREYFDRIIRRDEDLMAKCEYVAQNPVRRGLVRHPDEYTWLWRWWVDDAPPGAAAPHGSR